MTPIDTKAELNARLINLIDWIGSVGKEIESGAREQVPQLAAEIISFGLWQAVFFMVVSTLFGVGLIAIAMDVTRTAKKKNQSAEGLDGFLGVAGAITVVLGITINAHTVVKVTVAPRVYLVETASKWVK